MKKAFILNLLLFVVLIDCTQAYSETDPKLLGESKATLNAHIDTLRVHQGTQITTYPGPCLPGDLIYPPASTFSHQVFITNNGTGAAYNVTAVFTNFSSNFSSTTCTQIDPGSSCDMTVTYLPALTVGDSCTFFCNISGHSVSPSGPATNMISLSVAIT